MEKHRKGYYKYCVVPMCENNTKTALNKVYFLMPKDAGLRKKWCKVMRRDNVSRLSCLYCCEDHFNIEKDTENYMQYKIMALEHGQKVTLQLKKGVVPYIFDCQKKYVLQPPPERQVAIKRIRQALVKEALAEAALREVHLTKAGSTSNATSKSGVDIPQAESSVTSISVADLLEAGPSAASLPYNMDTKAIIDSDNKEMIEKDMESYVKYKLVGGTEILEKGVTPHKFKCQKGQEPISTPETVLEDVNSTMAITEEVFVPDFVEDEEIEIKADPGADECSYTSDDAPEDMLESDIPQELQTDDAASECSSSPGIIQQDVPMTDTPQVDVIIASVYRYLQNEYQSLKEAFGYICDLSPLSNILRRTADATGVNECTIAAILERMKLSTKKCVPPRVQKRRNILRRTADGSGVSKSTVAAILDARACSNVPGTRVKERRKVKHVTRREFDEVEDERISPAVHNTSEVVDEEEVYTPHEMKTEPPESTQDGGRRVEQLTTDPLALGTCYVKLERVDLDRLTALPSSSASVVQ